MDEIVTGLDVETTGLNVKVDKIIEVGCVVWDCGSNKPIEVWGCLVIPDGFCGLRKKITELTGITDEDIRTYGKSPLATFKKLRRSIKNAKYVMAHNAAYDRNIIKNEFDRSGIGLPNRIWIDSLRDVPWREGLKSMKLEFLPPQHGFLNPFPHRAVTDVLSMFKLAGMYKWKEIFSRVTSEVVRVIAEVTKEDRQKAKDENFRWDPDRKYWYYDMKKVDIKKKDYDFDIRVEKLPEADSYV